jgi:predicted transcriptional regulator
MATQARLSPETHEKVVRLAIETGTTQQQVIDIAVSKYEREVFLRQVNEGFASLRADSEAWREEQAEREAWDISLADTPSE